jgi:DNA-directed RNA polymerase subunit L
MENLRTSSNGYRADFELRNVPVSFINGLRRILLSEIPVVVLSNIQILENTTSMTHEMIQHRVSMLPVNVRADEVAVIRDTQLELRTAAETEAREVTPGENIVNSTPFREVTTDDFAAVGPRGDILLKDRELGTPLLFMHLKPGEAIHIKATLSIAISESQVCVSTFKNHIDPDVAKIDRDTFVAQAGDDPIAQREAVQMFDNFHIQRSFHRDAKGRPDWFDFTVESIGVYTASDLIKKAIEVYQEKINEFIKLPVLREENGWYRMEIASETYTLGALVQEIMYQSQLAEHVAYDIGHPLTPNLVVRFYTDTSTPEAVVDYFHKQASSLCENVLKSV